MKNVPVTTIKVEQNKAEFNAWITSDGEFHLTFDAVDIKSADELIQLLMRFTSGQGIA